MFGFKKELFRQIGMFDERFLGGGFEDFDFILRLIMADIAMVITEEVEYHRLPSTWNNELAGQHWNTKWRTNEGEVRHWGDGLFYEKQLEEEIYDYDLGPSVPTWFLPCKQHSYINGPSYEIFIISNYFRAELRGIPNNQSPENL